MPNDVLDITTQGSRKCISALDTAQLLYLLVNIRKPRGPATDQLPLNLCLVIDRSTSMSGIRLNQVKSATTMIIGELDASDIVSMVAFSDRAEVILPASRVESKAKLSARVAAITASGGTEIYQGLRAGLLELRKVPLETHINHLILLTDGRTYGDALECLQLAHTAAAQGIDLSAFGIGDEWDDEFLDELAGPSGGQSAYIESPSEVANYLQRRVRGLRVVYALNVRLAGDFPAGVNLQAVFKVAPFAQPLVPDGQEFRLGLVEGQLPLSILLTMAIEPHQPGHRIRLPVNLIADVPSRSFRDAIIKHEYVLDIVADEPPVTMQKSFVDAVQVLNFHQMNEQAWNDMELGRIKEATARMHRLYTRLLQAGHVALAQQAYYETKRLMTAGTLSYEGRKRLKYGTRSLLTRTVA